MNTDRMFPPKSIQNQFLVKFLGVSFGTPMVGTREKKKQMRINLDCLQTIYDDFFFVFMNESLLQFLVMYEYQCGSSLNCFSISNLIILHADGHGFIFLRFYPRFSYLVLISNDVVSIYSEIESTVNPRKELKLIHFHVRRTALSDPITILRNILI